MGGGDGGDGGGRGADENLSHFFFQKFPSAVNAQNIQDARLKTASLRLHRFKHFCKSMFPSAVSVF